MSNLIKYFKYQVLSEDYCMSGVRVASVWLYCQNIRVTTSCLQLPVLLCSWSLCSWRGQAVFCLLQREIRRRPDTNLPNTGSGLQIKQPVTERGDTFKQAISDSDLWGEEETELCQLSSSLGCKMCLQRTSSDDWCGLRKVSGFRSVTETVHYLTVELVTG